MQKVLIFLSDGAANYGGIPEPASYRNQPCQCRRQLANLAKAQGTTIYAIGYDLDGANGVYERCQTRSNAIEYRT